MTIDLKKWAGLGLGGLALGAGLTACGSSDDKDAPDAPIAEDQQPIEPMDSAAMPSAMGEMGEGEGGEGEGGEAGPDMETLPMPQRLAFMAGHVEAGLALYRAGEPTMAAPHLLHPVSETHVAERAGVDALGFDGSLFEAVSKALEEGRPASEVEPQLQAAEANLDQVIRKAGGNASEIIRFLMGVIVDEYTIAITDGKVSDPGEYQDAYGFAIVARERATQTPESTPQLLAALDQLVALWPADAPIPPDAPTPIGQVSAQTSVVVFALPE